MADFAGHIDVGISLTIVALWWLYNLCRDYVKSLEECRPFRSKLSYPTTIRGRKVHLEILLKIGMPLSAIIIQSYMAKLHWVIDGEFHHHDTMQHLTIYSLFTIHGVVDFIDYMRLSSMREFKYLTASLAYAWYGCAFYFHSSPETGKAPLERIVHRLLVVPVLMTALMYILEMLRRDLVVLQMIRCHSVLTFGTWFCYFSFILFSPTPFPGSHHNPAWDHNDMGNTHFMITAFGIHLIVNTVIVMTSFYVMESYRKCATCVSGFRQGGKSHTYEKVKLVAAEEFRDDDDEIPLINP